MQNKQEVKLIKSHNGAEQFAIFLEEQLGRGNFGIVRRAINLADKDTNLVVKIIPVGEQASFAQSELKIIRELPEHKNLVRILPVKCYSESNYYIFMEYCQSSLGELMRSGKKLSEDQLHQLFYELISGYKVLFDRKILHQDLKPDNILLQNGTFKIADFGLSVFYEKHKYSEKRQGTLSYIAPEKLTVRDYVGNPKSDIYSVGVIMFQLIVGKHPYLASTDYKGQMKQFLTELKESQLKLPPHYVNQFSLKMHSLLDIVIKMVSKTEQSRISFEDLCEYISKNEAFEFCRNGNGVKNELQTNKSPKIHHELIISQRSKVITLPLHVTEGEEHALKKSLRQQNEKQLKEQQQIVVKEISNYLINKRVLIYYFDKLARRLTVEQMRSGNRNVFIDRLIFYLNIVNRAVLNQMVKEMQNPSIFSFAKWKIFRGTQSRSLMDMVMKDYRYVEDTTCDMLAEDTKMPKKQQKDALQILKEENVTKLLASLALSLDQLLKEKVALIEVKNKSLLKTLVYMTTAVEIVRNLQQGSPQSEDLQNYHRKIETSNQQELLDSIVEKCDEWSYLYSLDFSGVDSETSSQILNL